MYARCYILNISDDIKQLRILNVDLEVNQESHIFLLHPGQFLNPDSKTKVEAKLGQNLNIDVTHSVSEPLMHSHFKILFLRKSGMGSSLFVFYTVIAFLSYNFSKVFLRWYVRCPPPPPLPLVCIYEVNIILVKKGKVRLEWVGLGKIGLCWLRLG